MQNNNPQSTFGPDLNEYTQNVDFSILAYTVDFIYLRASGSATGRFRIDRKFVQYAASCRDYGIPCGAYHYAVPSYDLTTADQQCDDFIGALQQGFGTNDYGELFPVVDVEAPTDKSISTTALINWVDRFRKRFESKTRRRLMLYTGLFFIELYNNFNVPGKGYPLSNMPLWIAMYRDVPVNPAVPPDIGGWKRWKIWQYTEKGRIRGISSAVDLNWGPDSIDFLIQPRVVRGLQATMDNNNIYVKWDKNSDQDLLGYNIFVNNYWVGTVDRDATSFVIKKSKLTLTPGKPIDVTIEAFDFDGEVSSRRAKVTL